MYRQRVCRHGDGAAKSGLDTGVDNRVAWHGLTQDSQRMAKANPSAAVKINRGSGWPSKPGRRKQQAAAMLWNSSPTSSCGLQLPAQILSASSPLRPPLSSFSLHLDFAESACTAYVHPPAHRMSPYCLFIFVIASPTLRTAPRTNVHHRGITRTMLQRWKFCFVANTGATT